MRTDIMQQVTILFLAASLCEKESDSHSMLQRRDSPANGSSSSYLVLGIQSLFNKDQVSVGEQSLSYECLPLSAAVLEQFDSNVQLVAAIDIDNE